MKVIVFVKATPSSETGQMPSEQLLADMGRHNEELRAVQIAEMSPDDPSGQTWMRVTVGYRMFEGKWPVLHEHVSIPFNPMNNQAWLITDPNNLSTPDYDQPVQS